MMLNKVEADIAHIKRQIEASEAKLELLKTEYTTYTRTLQETEQSLAKAITVSVANLSSVVSTVCLELASIPGLYSQEK